MRKTLLLTLIILVITGLIVGYVFLKKSAELTPITPADTELSIQDVILEDPLAPIEQSPTDPLQLITNDSVAGYWINSLDNQVYYATTDGSIKRTGATIDTAQTITSTKVLGSVREVVPTTRGEAALIISGTQQAPDFKIYDVEHQTWRALPSGTAAAAWGPTDDPLEIVYLKSEVEKTGLVTTSLNIYNHVKGSSRFVDQLELIDVRLTWPTTNLIYISNLPDVTAQPVWAYDLKKKTFREIVAPKAGLWMRWFGGGVGLGFDLTTGLYRLSPEATPSQWLPINTTPDKCLISDSSAYCAATEGIALNSARSLENYLLQRNSYSDDITKINEAGESLIVFSSKEKGVSFDITNLSKHDDSLYFINRYDQRLYSLALRSN